MSEKKPQWIDVIKDLRPRRSIRRVGVVAFCALTTAGLIAEMVYAVIELAK